MVAVAAGASISIFAVPAFASGPTLSPINNEIEKGSNTIHGGMICRAVGVPAKTKYTNSKGEAKEAKLEATVAGKTAGACELVGTALTSTIPLLPNKMVEVMG